MAAANAAAPSRRIIALTPVGEEEAAPRMAGAGRLWSAKWVTIAAIVLPPGPGAARQIVGRGRRPRRPGQRPGPTASIRPPSLLRNCIFILIGYTFLYELPRTRVGRTAHLSRSRPRLEPERRRAAPRPDPADGRAPY